MQAHLEDPTTESAARILNALRERDCLLLELELARESGRPFGPERDSGSDERAELLDAVVESLRGTFATGGLPGCDTEAHRTLLEHLCARGQTTLSQA